VSLIAAALGIDGHRVDPAVLRRMAGTAFPGPQIAEDWTEGAIGLAAGTDTRSGGGPREDDRCVVVWDGRIDNRPDLIGKLDGRPAPDASDAALLLAAYGRWGLKCLDVLVGDFAFVLWDRRERRLVAARDHLGVRPLHYTSDGRVWYVASHIEQFDRPAAGPVINEGVVGEFLVGKLDLPEDTFFESIRRVPPGHVLEIDRNGAASVTAYWTPDWDRVLHFDREQDYIDGFRDLFTQSVAGRLRSVQPVGLLLSDGVDSNAVATAIGNLNGEKRLLSRTLVTVTARFDGPGSDPKGRPPVVDAYGFEGNVIEGDAAWTFPAAPDGSAGLDEPLEGMYVVTLRRLMHRAQERGVGALLTGYAGDLLLTGSYYYLFELLMARRWPALLHELRCYSMGLRCRLLLDYVAKPFVLRRPTRTSRYRIPTWIARSFAARIDLPARVRPVRPDCPRRPVSRQAEADAISLAQHSTRMLWQQKEALRHRIELRHPFLDRRLFEFLLAVPVTEKIQHGRSKALLRRAILNGSTPPRESRRDRAARERIFDRTLRERERHDWELCFADPVSATLGYVDPAALRRAFARYLDGEIAVKYALARAYRLEMWLKRLLGQKQGS
jgi:asparagine synthase (glutamine-hydrolysing)